MVYDDYADIGIFAKWVMDAPEIGERAHPSVGCRLVKREGQLNGKANRRSK